MKIAFVTGVKQLFLTEQTDCNRCNNGRDEEGWDDTGRQEVEGEAMEIGGSLNHSVKSIRPQYASCPSLCLCSSVLYSGL